MVTILSKSDKLVFYAFIPLVVSVLGLFIVMSLFITYQSAPSLIRFGVDLLSSTVWRPADDPELEKYGLLAPVVGSLYVSVLATLITFPLSVTLTFTITEILHKRLREFLRSIVEIMGGLPTVVYGLWGSTVLAPYLRDFIMQPLYDHLGFIPIFSCKPVSGYSILTASLVLAIASTPYVTALLIEGYNMIPVKYKEGIICLGATKYETFKLLYGLLKPYVIASLLLSLSRALGETTIVALTVGNAMKLTLCLFDSTHTIPSLIASQFESARLYTYAMPTLFAGGLLLLLISLGASYVGIKKMYDWRSKIHV
ncbi:MAG: phosphate ABC transporter permease subunit PstC [Zestosphaera sp.]